MSTQSWPTTPGLSSRQGGKRVCTAHVSSDPKKRMTPTVQRANPSIRSRNDSLSARRSNLRHHDAEVDETQDHVIVALDKGLDGRTGCAYYIARHELLYCMQEIERGGSEMLEALKMETEPTVMLLSPRVNKSASGNPQPEYSLISDDAEHTPLPYEVVLRPASDFKYENAISKLGNINTFSQVTAIRLLVPGNNIEYDETQELDEFGLVDQPGKLLNTASNLDLNNTVSIGCVGAVIGYLQRKRTSEHPQHDPLNELAYRISRVEMFTLKDTMLLSTDTLSALQIIQSETHPNIANQGPRSSGSKESLSVYGLFHRFARTPQGKAKLRQIFLRPSLNMKAILDRHEFVSLMTRPENQSICDSISKSLARVKNMQTTLTSLRKGIERANSGTVTIRSGVWAALLEFCYHCIDVGDIIKEVAGGSRLAILAVAKQVLDRAQLQRIGKLIHDIVDLDESLEQHRTVVKRGVSEELDKVKEAYDRMEEVLAKVATDITNEMPSQIAEKLNVIFLPQLGFHVTVPLDMMTKEPVWEGDRSWERRFRTEEYQYFKNNMMRNMDVQWGDLYADICDAEIEISHNLGQNILQHEEWLLQASKYCGELDCLLALTHGALQHKLTRPKMVEGNVIDIKCGRHILLEMTVASYIPNDTVLAGGNDLESDRGASMILLTGPNYSGKSIYMKQVALIVYMAQIGSFVPADAAVLGLTDKILTRINTAETVSKVQSAFLIDLQQVSCALNSCTPRSLLLLDEFGKGTDNCDGAGLVCGVFKYLLGLGSESPMILASTHFHEIFERGDFDGYNNLQFANMDVHISDDGEAQLGVHASAVTYLYTLREGRSGVSYGNQCAAMNGVPQKVVERATLLADMVIRGEDLVSTCAALPKAELDELEDAEAVCRMFLSKDFVSNSADVKTMLEAFLMADASELVEGGSIC